MVGLSLQSDNPVIFQLVKSTYVLQNCLIRFLNFTSSVRLAAFCTFSGSISQSIIPLTEGLFKYFSYFRFLRFLKMHLAITPQVYSRSS